MAAPKVSTRVLIQLFGHFADRGNSGEQKLYFPKNSRIASYVETKGKISRTIRLKTLSVINDALVKKFGEMDSLGKVYIDESLSNYPVPSQMRKASDGMLQVARGSKLPFDFTGENRDIIRMFVYWVGRDIDLSVTIYNDKFDEVAQCYYGNVRGWGSSGLTHSGDITNAPNGASEFLDIDLNKVEGRYALMTTQVYSGPSFAELEECFVGWMMRDGGQKNEIYDPKTVASKINLENTGRTSCPVLFDLKEKKAIWLDLDTVSPKAAPNNIVSSKSALRQIVRTLTSTENKMTLYDLFMLHASSRGELVDNPEDADIVFSERKGDVTPFDVDEIQSKFIA
jgi:hypothetical protein